MISNHLPFTKNYSSSLVDDHLNYLNHLYKLEIKVKYGSHNCYTVTSKCITLDPNCSDILYSLYHEYYHALKQHESNSFQQQFHLFTTTHSGLDNFKFVVLMVFLLTCLGQYFFHELRVVSALSFFLCLVLCWYNPFAKERNSYKPKLHFNEYRADSFALKHLKRLPKPHWLCDIDSSFTHPSTKSRMLLLTRLWTNLKLGDHNV